MDCPAPLIFWMTMPKAKAGSISSTAHRLIAAKTCSRNLASGAATTLLRG